jgi:hypothetical protein
LLETAQDSQRDARGHARGVRSLRDALRALLVERFGPVPEPLVQRIEASEDMERLKDCIRQVLRIKSADELGL